MLDEDVIELSDADVVEVTDEDLITEAAARDAVRDRDHQIAVNTAQELIRQRGILMEDLESALNMCRRYRGILRDNALPDPCNAKLDPLLKKYGMTGARTWPKKKNDWTPEEQIAGLTVAILDALPPEDVPELPAPRRELSSGE